MLFGFRAFVRPRFCSKSAASFRLYIRIAVNSTSLSAVYFSSAINMKPHAACAEQDGRHPVLFWNIQIDQ